MIRVSGGDAGQQMQTAAKADRQGIVMARFEMSGLEPATLGQGTLTADAFYDLGIRYAVGNAVPADLVVAHKYFNIAALKGNKQAAQQRQEIAANMSPAEIAAALREARAWLRSH